MIGVSKAHLHGFNDDLFPATWRDERFIYIDNGEIKNQIIVNSCKATDYAEVIIYKETDRKEIFGANNNYQPFCCDSKSCKRGFLIIEGPQEKYSRYIVKGTCNGRTRSSSKRNMKQINATSLTIENINSTYKVNESNIYTALVANCGDGNFTISGSIDFKSSKSLDKRLKHMMYIHIILFLFTTASSLSIYYYSRMKSPLFSFSFFSPLSSLILLGAISLLHIIYYLLWNFNSIQLNFLIFIASIIRSLLQGLLFYSMTRYLRRPYEFPNYSSFIISLLILFLSIISTYSVNKISTVETGNWTLGYGNNFPYLNFFASIVIYSVSLIIYLEYTPDDGNPDAHKDNFVLFTTLNLVLYFSTCILFCVKRMEATMWKTRNFYWVGFVIENIFLIVQIFLTIGFTIVDNDTGYEMIDNEQENQTETKDISLVGGGFRKTNATFVNDDVEEEETNHDEENLDQLTPMPISNV